MHQPKQTLYHQLDACILVDLFSFTWSEYFTVYFKKSKYFWKNGNL